MEINYTLFNITTFMKILCFAYNNESISTTMRDMKATIEAAKDLTKAFRNEKTFRTIILITAGIVFSETFSELFTEIISNGEHQALVHNKYFFDDTRFTVVYVFLRIISLWSAYCHECVNIIILFAYYITCMHIKSLFEQLHDKLECLDNIDKNDEKKAKEIVKNCVNDHEKILNFCHQTQNGFKLILTISFINNILILSLALLSTITDSTMIINVGPAILFNLYMLCYPSWVVTNEVKIFVFDLI
jgi:hypothetical protein